MLGYFVRFRLTKGIAVSTFYCVFLKVDIRKGSTHLYSRLLLTSKSDLRSSLVRILTFLGIHHLHLIDFLLFYSRSGIFCSYGEITIVAEGLQQKSDLCSVVRVGRDLYRVTPAVVEASVFLHALIHTAAPFSCHLRQESTLTRIHMRLFSLMTTIFSPLWCIYCSPDTW